MRKPIKADINDPLFTEGNEQIVHTPMGTKIEPAKFNIGDIVKTSKKYSEENIEIPEGISLTIASINGDDIYSLIGPEGLVVTLHGAYLEKDIGGTLWGSL